MQKIFKESKKKKLNKQRHKMIISKNSFRHELLPSVTEKAAGYS